MGKFNETKWRECLQREMEMAPLDVVRGYAQDGLTLRLAAATMECPLPFLRSLARAAGIRFRAETTAERAPSATRAESLRAYYVSAGRMPVSELASLTGLSRKTIEARQARGLPKHRLFAADWPGRQGGRIGKRKPSVTRAKTVRAYHAELGRLPLDELARLTGIDRKTIERRRERGLPKHRLFAADWPGRQGGRKAKS